MMLVVVSPANNTKEEEEKRTQQGRLLQCVPTNQASARAPTAAEIGTACNIGQPRHNALSSQILTYGEK